jgi:iron-sulfur cluster assembly accessory protein
MMTLTEVAVEKIKDFMASEKKEGYGLRIFVSGGGCSGYDYGMDVEETPQDDDQVIEKGGVRIFLDPESFSLLSGAKVDFVEGTDEAGFSIENPNAKTGCGCANSSP